VPSEVVELAGDGDDGVVGGLHADVVEVGEHGAGQRAVPARRFRPGHPE